MVTESKIPTISGPRTENREGFLALAPDALSPLGGTPEDNINKARSLIRKIDRESTIKNFVAAGTCIHSLFVQMSISHPWSAGNDRGIPADRLY